MIGRFLTVVGERGALVGDIETVFVGRDHFLREVGVTVFDEDHLEEISQAVRDETESEVTDVKDVVFERHLGGKIRSGRTTPVEGLDDLRTIYTPGVARVCRAIERDPAPRAALHGRRADRRRVHQRHARARARRHRAAREPARDGGQGGALRPLRRA